MGDKSPKSVDRKAKQKQAKTTSDKNKRRQETAAKQVIKKG